MFRCGLFNAFKHMLGNLSVDRDVVCFFPITGEDQQNKEIGDEDVLNLQIGDPRFTNSKKWRSRFVDSTDWRSKFSGS